MKKLFAILALLALAGSAHAQSTMNDRYWIWWSPASKKSLPGSQAQVEIWMRANTIGQPDTICYLQVELELRDSKVAVTNVQAAQSLIPVWAWNQWSPAYCAPEQDGPCPSCTADSYVDGTPYQILFMRSTTCYNNTNLGIPQNQDFKLATVTLDPRSPTSQFNSRITFRCSVSGSHKLNNMGDYYLHSMYAPADAMWTPNPALGIYAVWHADVKQGGQDTDAMYAWATGGCKPGSCPEIEKPSLPDPTWGVIKRLYR